MVTHIGSGSITEMDVSLDILLHLAKIDIENMVVYDIFIKGILDYLDTLTLLQIRTLFNIFSLLSLTVCVFLKRCNDILKHTLCSRMNGGTEAPAFGLKSK